ncbi:hypothetical protein PV11_09532 [Exophiala sideris]|uniref:Uncharacterized protein n=1 Tax=Exophiala sideris TaxID=1016849 RepID=A0A0D1WRP9_9EURO|nr:hypothetical protein PV11_09532 [Exophiala sideris]
MSTSRNSSTSSAASDAGRKASVDHQSKPRHVSSVCYPKGKWYDCLRPTTTPYSGFGSMANFATGTGKENQPDVGENWTQDIYGKMNTFDTVHYIITHITIMIQKPEIGTASVTLALGYQASS